MAAHRIANFYNKSRPKGLKRWLLLVVVRFSCYISKVVAKCHILPSAHIEAGVYFSDRGHIILGAQSIGSGSLIHDRVTIGINLKNKGKPKIGRNVWIGPHCIVTGDITIGDGVTILPGTVLTKHLRPGVVVQGNPARIIKHDFDNCELRQTLTTDVERFVCGNKG